MILGEAGWVVFTIKFVLFCKNVSLICASGTSFMQIKNINSYKLPTFLIRLKSIRYSVGCGGKKEVGSHGSI